MNDIQSLDRGDVIVWWRILIALGGVSFIGSGIGVLTDETCAGVTWASDGAGARRLFTATCWPWSPDSVQMAGAGAWDPSAAGLMLVGAGVGMVVIAAWPLIQTWRATGSHSRPASYTPNLAPRATPVIPNQTMRTSSAPRSAEPSQAKAGDHEMYTKYNVGIAVMTAHLIWLEPLQRWSVAEGFGSSQGSMLHRKQEFETRDEALDHLRLEGYDITSPMPYQSSTGSRHPDDQDEHS